MTAATSTVRIRGALVVALVAVALAGTSCGDDDDTATSSSASGDGASEVASDDSAPDGDEQGADGPESPLAEYLGFSTDPAEQEDRFAEQERQRQQFVAQCMAAEGFEYTPVDNASFVVSIGPGGGVDEADYVERYGFGISTTFLDGPRLPQDASDDPNLAYLERLTDEEREAYDLALYGDMSQVDGATTGQAIEVTPDLLAEQGGCFTEAMAEVDDPFREVFEELGDELSDLQERLQNEPRMVAANEAWAECMAGAGHPYDTQEDMFADISERMTPLYEAFSSPPGQVTVEGGGGGGVIVGGGIVGEGDSFEGPPELTAEQQATLEEIQTLELAVAAANLECQGELANTRAEVMAELEQAFVDEHRAELEQLLAD